MIKLSELIDTSNLTFTNIKQANSLSELLGKSDEELANISSKYITEMLYSFFEEFENIKDKDTIIEKSKVLKEVVSLPEGEWVFTILNLLKLLIVLENNIKGEEKSGFILGMGIKEILDEIGEDIENISLIDFAGMSYYYDEQIKRKIVSFLFFSLYTFLVINNTEGGNDGK